MTHDDALMLIEALHTINHTLLAMWLGVLAIAIAQWIP
jgi:hypothetical protein